LKILEFDFNKWATTMLSVKGIESIAVLCFVERFGAVVAQQHEIVNRNRRTGRNVQSQRNRIERFISLTVFFVIRNRELTFQQQLLSS